MIVFGARASKIKKFETLFIKCAYCEKRGIHTISIFGSYFHVYWIPVFPIGKKGVAECTSCKRTTEEKDFSPELKSQYVEEKLNTKRPFWYWSGLYIIAIFFGLIWIVAANQAKDSRKKLFGNDMDLMTASPTMESDSVSFKIKSILDIFANETLNTKEFEYLTKTSENKVLVLVKMPDLKRVEKEGRMQALEVIEEVLDRQETLKGKEKYIGVQIGRAHV